MELVYFDTMELVAYVAALLAIPAGVLGVSLAVEAMFKIISASLRGYDDEL